MYVPIVSREDDVHPCTRDNNFLCRRIIQLSNTVCKRASSINDTLGINIPFLTGKCIDNRCSTYDPITVDFNIVS